MAGFVYPTRKCIKFTSFIMKKIIWWGIEAFLVFMIGVYFFGWWKDIPGLEFLGNKEERMNCPEEVTGLTTPQTNSSKQLQLVGIKMNRVSYPLNKKEAMLEYCVTVENFSSSLGNIGLQVQFLDKDENVLAEVADNIIDVPGKRSKTIYGSTFVSTQISKEVTSVQVSGVRWGL